MVVDVDEDEKEAEVIGVAEESDAVVDVFGVEA